MQEWKECGKEGGGGGRRGLKDSCGDMKEVGGERRQWCLEALGVTS